MKQLVKGANPTNPDKKYGPVFHDRFFLEEFGGFYIGTLVNSIFRNGTIITEFSGEKEIMDHFDKWFSGTSINVNGKKYSCKVLYSHERTDFSP